MTILILSESPPVMMLSFEFQVLISFYSIVSRSNEIDVLLYVLRIGHKAFKMLIIFTTHLFDLSDFHVQNLFIVCNVCTHACEVNYTHFVIQPQYTLRLHYNAVVGVHRGKTHYNGPRYIHVTIVQNL